jgi:hypothetical protein
MGKHHAFPVVEIRYYYSTGPVFRGILLGNLNCFFPPALPMETRQL